MPTLSLTPLLLGTCQPDLLEGFTLELEDEEQLSKKKKKKIPRIAILDALDEELQRVWEDIIEQDSMSEAEESDSEDEEEEEEDSFSSPLNKDEEERQSTVDLPALSDEERLQRSPRVEIFRQLEQLESQELDEEERRSLVKRNLEKYLLAHERFCFEEAWSALPASLPEALESLRAGIQESFGKKVGGLSFEARRVKLLHYIEKKKRRLWVKKVSYDCRKKVADSRLRIKGKFVTR